MPIGTISNGEAGSSVRTKLNAAIAQLNLETAAGRALVEAANVAAQHTALGGTTAGVAMFQAADAAAQNTLLGATAAGLAIFTAANVAAQQNALGGTAAGVAIFTAADAAAQRTALGLGTIATQAASSVAITGGSITGLTQFGVSMAINSAMTGFALGTISDTTARPFIISQTLNNASLSATVLRLDITDTTSAAGSEFFQINRGGSRFLAVSRFTAFGISNMPKIEGDGNGAGYLCFNNSHGTAVLGRKDGGWNWVAGYNEVFAPSGSRIGWSSNGFSASLISVADTGWYRDAANIIAQRAGTSAQTYRVYGTYTDASNYVRASLASTSSLVTLAAETAGTGADDIDLALTPAGTGCVRYGTHSAVGAETITGYITIKDAAGNARKLAVIS